MSTANLQKENGFIVRSFQSLTDLQSKYNLVKAINHPKGVNLFDRYTPVVDYITKNEAKELAVEERGLESAPNSTTTASDQHNLRYFGSNFASNNYLSLASHPSTVEAATEAANTFGVNSAGSPLAFGATKYYMQLKEEIAEFWNCKALIYSSGWLAAYGAVKSLVKDYDYVIIDEFADNPFFEGAYASTKNVFKNRHLDEKHIEQLLKSIRAKDQENGIMVVTQSIFTLDSCSPNLVNIQRIAKQNNAFVAIGCTHDFGVIGDQGRGVWEEQKLEDRSNVLFVGSGSRTSSINFGFVGCVNPIIPEYMKYFSASYMFTNAINPVQANTALATLRIIRSEEGKNLRRQLLANCTYLRERLEGKGHRCLGRASGFVCVRVGDEIVSRIIVRILMDNQMHVNNVEYPLAPLGQAVVRFSLSPTHTIDQIDKLVAAFDFVVAKAKSLRPSSSSPVCAKL